MPENESVERSSAKYAAIMGICLMTLYGATLALWAIAAPGPEDEPFVTVAERVSQDTTTR